jgi:hypothetical protein
MDQFARVLMLMGIVIFLAGGVLYLLNRTGLSLGSLPGTIRIQGQNMTCIIPILASIVLSILLTVVLNIVIRFLNR